MLCFNSTHLLAYQAGSFLEGNTLDLRDYLLVAVPAGKTGLVAALDHWHVAELLATHALHLHPHHAHQTASLASNLLPAPPLLYETRLAALPLPLYRRHSHPAQAEFSRMGFVLEDGWVFDTNLVEGNILYKLFDFYFAAFDNDAVLIEGEIEVHAKSCNKDFLDCDFQDVLDALYL
jgi:hypothetical protein